MNNITETELAKRLREEAAADSPAFSPLLHERIMQRVRSAARLPAERRRSLPLPWVFGLAAAAAFALAIGLPTWLRPSKPSVRTPRLVKVDPLPSPANIVDTRVTPMYEQLASAMDERKLAYLDRDARELTDFVKGRLALAMVNK
ncbi:MAG: hypothetical protein ACHRHE_20555 [Tepidisphaerales bacterium]